MHLPPSLLRRASLDPVSYRFPSASPYVPQPLGRQCSCFCATSPIRRLAQWQSPNQHTLRYPSQQIPMRSEEHTSELHSLMRISYAVFCLIKKTFSLQTTFIRSPPLIMINLITRKYKLH